MTVPARTEVEAKVVASRAHRMSFGDMCLDCGGDVRQPRCEPDMLIPAAVWTAAAIVPGEVV